MFLHLSKFLSGVVTCKPPLRYNRPPRSFCFCSRIDHPLYFFGSRNTVAINLVECRKAQCWVHYYIVYTFDYFQLSCKYQFYDKQMYYSFDESLVNNAKCYTSCTYTCISRTFNNDLRYNSYINKVIKSALSNIKLMYNNPQLLSRGINIRKILCQSLVSSH